jgi:hypothetical protein
MVGCLRPRLPKMLLCISILFLEVKDETLLASQGSYSYNKTNEMQ